MIRRRLVLLCLALLAAGAYLVVPHPEPRVVVSALDRRMVTFIDGVIGRIDAASWPGSSGCFRCDAGPALALAGAAAVTGDRVRRDRATAVFDDIIREQRRPSGAFGPDDDGADIDTMFFAAELGLATLLLHDDLDEDRRAAWTAAVTGAADFLIGNRNLNWYTNGNIVVGNALVMALAERLSDNPEYVGRYRQAWTFALDPPDDRWGRFGLRTTRDPRRADGSDGRAYLVEEGPHGAGYDPDYTMLQLDQVTRIFLVNRDPQALRVMNLLMNQLLEKVDRTTWQMDMSVGSRRADPGARAPFDTAGLTTLVHLGGRTDLAGYLPAQLDAVEASFERDLPVMNDRSMYAFGMVTASIIMSR